MSAEDLITAAVVCGALVDTGGEVSGVPKIIANVSRLKLTFLYTLSSEAYDPL